MSKYGASAIFLILGVMLIGIAIYLNYSPAETAKTSGGDGEAQNMSNKVDWKEKLTPLQYHVTREHGTERAFTGKYWDHKEDGIYTCVCCGQPLFDSTTKFKSGSGWPSFFDLINRNSIKQATDDTLVWEQRTELICSQCDAHLGHVFPDGPQPTGLRYCINSAALDFEERKD